MIHNLAFGPEYTPALLHYHRCEVDQGRLVVWTDVKTPFNKHKAIEDVLKSHRIFARVIHDEESNAYGIDVPLKRSDPDKLLKKTIRVLKENQWIDSTTHDEITKVWKAVQNTHYFRACTEGVAPPLEKHARNWQSGNFEFRPILNAFQNVILYDLARGECSQSQNDACNDDSEVNPFHQDLMKVARANEFLNTPENQELKNKLLMERSTWQNLVIPGPDGLNPMDHLLRSRNGGLARLILFSATSYLVDKRIDRAILNAILREVENSARLKQSTDYPWNNFSSLFLESDLQNQLSKEKQNELDAYVGSLIGATIELYTFLLSVFYPGPDQEKNEDWIWIPIKPKGIDNDGKETPDFSDAFEDVFDLKNTFNAFILDRILKWIANEQPGKAERSENHVYEIYKNLPADFISDEAQTIVSKLICDATNKIMCTPIEKNNLTIEKINRLLGDEFTAKHGLKWIYDSRGAYRLADFFITIPEKSWFERRFKEGKLKGYLFIPFPGYGYQLVIPEPVQIGETDPKKAVHPSVSASGGTSSKSSSSSSSTSNIRAQIPLEHKSRLAQGYLEKMKGFLKENKYDNAMSAFDSLIDLNPEDTSLLKNVYQIAHEKYTKMRFHEAIDIYERFFKIANSNLETLILDQAHFECGAAHHALNQLDEASRHYGIIIDHSLADLKIKADALMNRAAIFTEQGNYAEALKDTEEAVKAGEAAKLDSDLLEIWKEQVDSLKDRLGIPPAASQSTSQSLGGLTGLTITYR